jgi:hypothetical protein
LPRRIDGYKRFVPAVGQWAWPLARGQIESVAEFAITFNSDGPPGGSIAGISTHNGPGGVNRMRRSREDGERDATMMMMDRGGDSEVGCGRGFVYADCDCNGRETHLNGQTTNQSIPMTETSSFM